LKTPYQYLKIFDLTGHDTPALPKPHRFPVMIKITAEGKSGRTRRPPLSFVVPQNAGPVF